MRPRDLAAVVGLELSGLRDGGVERITPLDVTDDPSWPTSWQDSPERYTGGPLLFDGEGRAEPSDDAVASVLRGRGRRRD